MPHVTVSLYPGASERQKRELARRIRDALIESVGAKETAVSVRLREVGPDEWKSRVYDEEIAGRETELYIKPGYDL